MQVLFLTLMLFETTDLQGVVVATMEVLADPGTISPPIYHIERDNTTKFFEDEKHSSQNHSVMILKVIL